MTLYRDEIPEEVREEFPHSLRYSIAEVEAMCQRIAALGALNARLHEALENMYFQALGAVGWCDACSHRSCLIRRQECLSAEAVLVHMQEQSEQDGMTG